MHDSTTVTAEWHPTERAGQMAALVALLFAPETVTADDTDPDAP